MTRRAGRSATIAATPRTKVRPQVTALCKAYPTHEAASEAVGALLGSGVPGDRLRVLTGEPRRDVREEDVGQFAGAAAPDAPVGSFGDVPHRRDEPRSDFASTGGGGRIGTFADADRDTVTTYADGVGRMHVTGDHDVERILVDAGLDADAARRDAQALHEGWALVLVRDPDDPDGAQRVLDDAA
jgi:hypothetical protein